MHDMQVKCEQNRTVQSTRNFEVFNKKTVFYKTIFDKAFDAILEDVSVAKANV